MHVVFAPHCMTERRVSRASILELKEPNVGALSLRLEGKQEIPEIGLIYLSSQTLANTR